MKEFPVTRISVNPQTMNQKTLDVIGRKHTVEDTINIFHMARELEFDNINMDLIIGLPGEGKEEVAHTLQEVEKLHPDSLTIHSLALKRATRLNLFKDKYEEMSFEKQQGDHGNDPAVCLKIWVWVRIICIVRRILREILKM